MTPNMRIIACASGNFRNGSFSERANIATTCRSRSSEITLAARHRSFFLTCPIRSRDNPKILAISGLVPPRRGRKHHHKLRCSLPRILVRPCHLVNHLLHFLALVVPVQGKRLAIHLSEQGNAFRRRDVHQHSREFLRADSPRLYIPTSNLRPTDSLPAPSASDKRCREIRSSSLGGVLVVLVVAARLARKQLCIHFAFVLAREIMALPGVSFFAASSCTWHPK